MTNQFKYMCYVDFENKIFSAQTNANGQALSLTVSGVFSASMPKDGAETVTVVPSISGQYVWYYGGFQWYSFSAGATLSFNVYQAPAFLLFDN